MLVLFSDHTSSVDGVVLAGSVAEEVLQHLVSRYTLTPLSRVNNNILWILLTLAIIMTDLQVNDLLGMMTEQRTEVKAWLLLERYKVVLKSQVYMYRCV